MPVTAERFAQGITFDQYMAQMNTNQEEFAANYAAAELDPDDVAFITNVGLPLKVVVITEDWCGDALMYVPLLARLADCTDSWEARYFLRDENPDLIDQFLNEGKHRSIPVFAFFDEDMREMAVFIERPALANAERQELVDRFADDYAAIEIGKPPRDQSEDALAVLRGPLREQRAGRKQIWQRAAIDEIRDALQKLTVARTLAED